MNANEMFKLYIDRHHDRDISNISEVSEFSFTKLQYN